MSNWQYDPESNALVRFPTTDELIILEGQHRMAMLEFMKKPKAKPSKKKATPKKKKTVKRPKELRP